MEPNASALIPRINVCLGSSSMGLVVFISLDPVLRVPNGMELTVHLILTVLLVIMVIPHLAKHCHKDAHLQPIGPMVDAWYPVLVLKAPTSEVEIAFLMFPVRMDKCGTTTWLIVFVLRAQNGMVRSV